MARSAIGTVTCCQRCQPESFPIGTGLLGLDPAGYPLLPFFKRTRSGVGRSDFCRGA